MTKHLYEDFDPEEEVRLSDACYAFGDPEVVAQARKLIHEGFDSNGVVIISGDWRDEMYRKHRAAMRALQEEIRAMIKCEALIAFGYDENPIEGPKWLKPALWQHAKIRFPASKLMIGGSKGLTISHIIVFQAKYPQDIPVDRTAKPIKPAELERAYRAYVDKLKKAGDHSNREDDVKAMKNLFDGNATHNAVYKLRQKYAPKAWQVSGRRKSREK